MATFSSCESALQVLMPDVVRPCEGDSTVAHARRNYCRVARQFCVFSARADPTVFVPDRLL